jgi:hypothetical protein
VYLQLKNTFLDFYDDEISRTRGNATKRALSVDSKMKAIQATNVQNVEPLGRSVSASLEEIAGTSSSDGSCALVQDHPPETPGKGAHVACQAAAYSPAQRGVSQGGAENDRSRARHPPSPIHASNLSQSSNPPSPMSTVSQLSPQQHHMAAQGQRTELKTTSDGQPITTLMIRGIPCSHSSEAVRSILDKLGFVGTYDFFYLPKAGHTQSNLGYAFVNFPSPAVAQRCADTLSSVPLDPRRSTKLCSTSAADIQGLEQLRKFFRRTSVSRGNRGPIFLKVHDSAPTQ